VIALDPIGGWSPMLLTTGRLPMEAHLLAPDGGLEGTIDVPSNVMLLRRTGATVLIDAGSGSLAVDWPGAVADLVGALAAVGCTGADVDTVILTHLDFDHCGGCAELPRARVLVPEGAEPSSAAAEGVIERLRADRRLETVTDGAEAMTGVILRSAPGHRAGHSVVEIGAGLVHLADVVHHPLHVEHLGWDREFDSDVPLALATRTRLLEEMADRGVTVTASHISGPGRIERQPAGGLRWRGE